MRAAATVALLLALVTVARAAADRPHVYLVVVDGLDARAVSASSMPHLFAALARDPERSSLFAAARAVMPARTNPNHVSLLTGVYPEAHGITGNAWWTRVAAEPPRKLDDPALIEVQTLFTVAEEHAPELVTVAAFAKPKLAHLFAAVEGRQRGPDHVWTAEPLAPDAAADDLDARTMTAALGLMERPEPDLAVIGLAGVDRTAHRFGPDGPEYARALGAADAAIGELLDRVRGFGRWGRSVVIVTADHGFAGVGPAPERPYPLIPFGRELLRAHADGVRLVDDGRVEHVYAEAADAGGTPTEEGSRALARVAELASATPGVAEVLGRVPVSGVTPLATAHADWHLGHPRTGDLLLVAARGQHFDDPFDPVDADMLGDHGGPEETAVPLFVTGGAPQLTAAPAGTPAPASVDVAPTIEALLGLPAARRVDGSPVAAELSGRAVRAVLTEAAPSGGDQSPH